MKDTHRKTLIYDGSCRTCRVLKNAADKTVSEYDFVDATSDVGKALALEKNLNTSSGAYVIDGDRVLAKSDMAITVLHDMRVFGPIIATCARMIPYSWREGIYEWLVRHRIR